MKDDKIFVLIQYRIKQAEESLEDAKALLDGGRSPRSIINRSYYAMFYAVLALLQKIGKVPRKHSGAISFFDTEYVLKDLFPKKLSKDLHDIFNRKRSR
ncbi:MAG: antitoxin [Thermodesulfobacteriota bacterium]|nr:MAG: antitoxin [Thermodesulfobacteriota bacterium]